MIYTHIEKAQRKNENVKFDSISSSTYSCNSTRHITRNKKREHAHEPSI